MDIRIRRTGVASATFVGLLITLFAAGPVLADQEEGHTGEVGVHSLVDTSTKPGTKCRYEVVTPNPPGVDHQTRLKRLDVRPPKVRAISGEQTTGWRFRVQRRENFGAWITTYSSAIQIRTASATQDAAFTPKSVRVTVPTASANDAPYYEWRVLVKMFWYTADGSVQGTALHRVQWYRYANYDSVGGSSNNRSPCSGWFATRT